MSLERLWNQLLLKKKAPFVFAFLFLLSIFYQALIALRHLFYDLKVFKTTKLQVPVVSIGNIEVGGTGKTPLTHLLASALAPSVTVAILSRGYRALAAKTKKPHLIQKTDGSEEVGDEPLLLFKKLKGGRVWVGKDRLESALCAQKEGAALLLLDDGMQQRKLIKDFEIALVDAQDPLCGGYFLPRGRLRDFPKRLKNADLVVITPCFSKQEYQQASQRLQAWTKAPLVGMRPKLKIACSDKKVAIFCGIAKPQSFKRLLEDEGMEVVLSLFKEDHEGFLEEELEDFVKECQKKKISTILCTEKDGIKIKEAVKMKLNIVEVPLVLEIAYHKEAWDEMIEKIRQKALDYTQKSTGRA